MRAGDLDQRITLQAKVVTRTAMGAEAVTWEDVETVWASAEPLSGREYIAARAAQADVTVRFRVRARPWLTPTHRILWRDVPYSITEVIGIGTRRAGLEILAVGEAAT